MQGDDLLSLRLSIGGGYHFEPTKKRKRIDEPNDKNLMALLQARDRMIRLGCNRHGVGDDKGLQLVRLLLLCATAVDRNDLSSTTGLLRELYRNVSLSGNPIQRVIAYFTDGLMARFMTKNSSFYSSIMADPSPEEEFSAFTSLCLASPYYQFAHFTANQAIFEAFEEDEHWNGGCLHVIDFDVSYGLQWPSLIQSLSEKATNQKPISLLITVFGRSIEELRDTEKRLSSFASGFRNLFFEFEGKLRGENGQEEIKVKKNSTVAVNLVFYLHTLKNFSDICTTLMQINKLNPSVVTLVEKEWSRGNHSGFLSRFMESLQYFSAMFDSLDDCLPSRNKERLRIEKNHLGREIRHAVVFKDEEEEKGCRYERLETWQAVMERYRFEGVRMSSRSVSQAKLLIKIKSHCSAMDDHGTGFRIFERDEGKAISLGWQDTQLITATAWRRSS